MSAAEARVRRIAELRRQGVIAVLAARISDQIPNTVAMPVEDGIVITTRLALDDARLRWISELLR
ncbi:hypothetical protein [Sphingomonas immobilis]|uniref:Uncharacterized protein n=1 Tax=Sphingomonas immobilis TaxID=3063997 RepID=A0ABT9A1P8_9SPHN|nr:hypothetical protein [Sphingomonas sp. CA1-15]MDO7843744.1 hypothetical protein [Sphingomonas sp. CA1-15]